MQLSKLALVALAVVPAALHAQTTVFNTSFVSDTLNQASYTPTSSATAWNIASGKNATSSISGGNLNLGIPATTSGFVEAQTVLPGSYALTNNTESLAVTVVFTATSNILTGGTGSQVFVGLFEGDGNKPLANLQTSGITTTAGSANATGGTQLWQGYNSRISYDAGSSAVITRPKQNGVGTTSANQDLLFQGGGGAYVNPGGVNLATSAALSATAALTNGSTYTLTYSITRTDSSTLSFATNLYDGIGTTGTNLASISATATGANLLTSTFSALAFGYRYSNTSAASSIAVNDLTVVYTAVPEPSSFAALAGLAGLGLVATRRRRSA